MFWLALFLGYTVRIIMLSWILVIPTMILLCLRIANEEVSHAKKNVSGTFKDSWLKKGEQDEFDTLQQEIDNGNTENDKIERLKWLANIPKHRWRSFNSKVIRPIAFKVSLLFWSVGCILTWLWGGRSLGWWTVVFAIVGYYVSKVYNRNKGLEFTPIPPIVTLANVRTFGRDVHRSDLAKKAAGDKKNKKIEEQNRNRNSGVLPLSKTIPSSWKMVVALGERYDETITAHTKRKPGTVNTAYVLRNDLLKFCAFIFSTPPKEIQYRSEIVKSLFEDEGAKRGWMKLIDENDFTMSHFESTIPVSLIRMIELDNALQRDTKCRGGYHSNLIISIYRYLSNSLLYGDPVYQNDIQRAATYITMLTDYAKSKLPKFPEEDILAQEWVKHMVPPIEHIVTSHDFLLSSITCPTDMIFIAYLTGKRLDYLKRIERDLRVLFIETPFNIIGYKKKLRGTIYKIEVLLSPYHFLKPASAD